MHPAHALPLVLVALAAATKAQSPVDFDRDVRPILSHHCFPCHGPDAATRKADLRLDLRDAAMAVIEPGDAQKSELVARIRHTDADERMPPAAADKPLDNAKIALLVRWIDEGAVWREHWSFVPPADVAPPQVDAAVARGFDGNEIDAFVLARLQANGLQPNPPADRATLLRRVTLDLTGLPPTEAELDAFVTDDRADAYEQVVDRLLATDAYGEHMARYWLDAARYGDTHGLHLDNYREMWPYRDQVVRAFCDNQPYDRFVVEQLAGDLLDEPTQDQLIASGFNRCLVTTNEGGSITEEVYVRNVVDRVSTTGTVFLGLTLGCAVCHDHKFDPISQREFYELFAFFNNVDGSPMDGNRKDHAPVLKVPTAAQTQQLSALDEEQQRIEGRIQELLVGMRYEEPATDPHEHVAKKTLVWIDDELPAGAEAEGDGLVWTTEDEGPVHRGARAMRRTSQGLQQHLFQGTDRPLRLAAGDVLFAWVHLDPKHMPREIMLQWNDGGGWEHRAFWGEDVIPWGYADTASRRRLGDLPEPGVWTRLEVPVEAVGLGDGTAVHGIAFTQHDGTGWWDEVGVETSADQEPVDHLWFDDDAPDGASLQGDGKTWRWVQQANNGPKPRSGARMLRRQAGSLSQDYFTGANPPLVVQQGDRLFAWVWLDPKDPPRSVQLQFHVDNSWDHRVRWGDEAHGAGRQGGADYRSGDLPTTGSWQRLDVDLASVGLAPGNRIDGWALTQVGGTVYWDGAGVSTFAPPTGRHLTSLRAWEPIGRADGKLPKDVKAALKVQASKRSEEQQRAIERHYLRHVHAPSRATFVPLEAELQDIATRRAAIEKQIPTTQVMKERAEPKPAYVLVRGLYDRKGEQVERHTPRALPPMADDLPRDRLGLARWLIDPEHPLTARVAVNRFWQQLFGTGIVRTSEDFGNQGERPSHPQLLDWLARRFVADGWDIKRLMKRMVMSRTYRQSSRVDAEALRIDPDNRLLSRGARFRLDGETLRDQALMLSGLLVRDVGGPPVKPPQPSGLWKAVGYSSSNTANFRADTTPDKVHRRSLYTFFKRTAPPPQMTTFDAPSREECRVRRERTNTPMQALMLMNDPQYVEAARAFAERALTEPGPNGDRGRIAWALRLATCRAPEPAEVQELERLLQQERRAFEEDPEASKKLLATGVHPAPETIAPAELAAWTMVMNLILNLDEVVTKG